MSETVILDKANLPLALGARVGVIFEVIRLGEADEQSNVTLRAVDPCPGSNFKPEISLHGQHCVLIEPIPMPARVNGTPVEEHEETAGGGGGQAGSGVDVNVLHHHPERRPGDEGGDIASGSPAAARAAANEVPAETGGAQSTDTPPAA